MGQRLTTVGVQVSVLPSAAAWNGMRVLITGHSGFKGSWLSVWLDRLGANVLGLSLPEAPTSPSLWQSLDPPISQVNADICCSDWFDIVRDFSPEVVFHLAAQSIVAEGYRDPLRTFDTNVLGTGRLLNALRDSDALRAVLVVTTDKVYDSRQVGPYREGAYLGGKDPYSASKAAVELLCSSWPENGLPLVTVRAGNVIGGGDWASERLIPDLVRAWSNGRELLLRDLYGVRPWQHVLEPLRGYLLHAEALMAQKPIARTLNFGPAAEDFVDVSSLVAEAAEVWARLGQSDHPPTWVAREQRPYEETRILTLDSSLAREQLGWEGALGWRQAVIMTLRWYLDFLGGKDACALVNRDIDDYCRRVEAA